MFVDIHCHILPGIDDGAADMNAALDMIGLSDSEGDDNCIIATPHYICGSLKNDTDVVMKKLMELSNASYDKGFNVNLHSGNEIFLSTEVPELLEENKICTLAGSSYVLVELPMMSVPEYTEEVLYRLQIKGYKPIIAHPERNQDIINNPDIVVDLARKGIYFQVNASSIKGIYGKMICEVALMLIRHDLVHFVASDAHSCRGRSTKLRKAYNIVRDEFGRDTADRLFCNNGLAVLEDRELAADEPKDIKKGFMHKLQYKAMVLRAMSV